MRDFETLNKLSRGSFTYAKFVKLRDLAKNTIGESNDIFEIELSSVLNLYKNIDDHIIELDKQISTIIKDLNPPTLSIPGISRFSNAAKMLSFAGLEPGIIESGTLSSKGKMVKRGSGYLRYSLMNVALTVIKYNNTFYNYYYKKISEGKCHRVALSHVCKKLIRVIYTLEKNNIDYNPSLLK